ncbi:MAG: family 10 glycosylhydrolase [Planctomycetota bacterium]
MPKLLALLCLALTATAFAQDNGLSDTSQAEQQEVPPLPDVPRELRGVWVATVANIDWPSKPGLPSDVQQAEALAILDRVVETGMNVVILQVRPAADALYPSEIEPWSYYLTGEQGKAPEPFYDPLEFWVDAAHARSLELHVWLNPFRVKPNNAPFEPGPDSIARKNSDAVLQYGDDTRNQLWMDPANEDARAQTLAVFADLVERYDIDGVHMDDYFYPYPVGNIPFPDDASYAKYKQAGGELELNDFRRDSVNNLVEGIYRQTKSIKPHVKVGISPFGIWRPGNPPSVAGFDQYDKLYADAKLWLNEGWVDYYTPQLYWNIAAPQQSFPALFHWWANENTQSRTLAPGLFTGRIGENQKDWPIDEIAGQVYITRYSGVGHGNVHFSMKWIMADIKGIGTALRDTVYAKPALVPAMTWIDDEPPVAPTDVTLAPIEVTLSNAKPVLPEGEWFKPLEEKKAVSHKRHVRVEWKSDADDARLHVVQYLLGGTWHIEFVPADQLGLTLGEPADAYITHVAVSTVDRLGNQSEPAMYERPVKQD